MRPGRDPAHAVLAGSPGRRRRPSRTAAGRRPRPGNWSVVEPPVRFGPYAPLPCGAGGGTVEVRRVVVRPALRVAPGAVEAEEDRAVGEALRRRRCRPSPRRAAPAPSRPRPGPGRARRPCVVGSACAFVERRLGLRSASSSGPRRAACRRRGTRRWPASRSPRAFFELIWSAREVVDEVVDALLVEHALAADHTPRGHGCPRSPVVDDVAHLFSR